MSGVTAEERSCLRDPIAFCYCGEHQETVRNVVNHILCALEALESRIDLNNRVADAELREMGDRVEKAERQVTYWHEMAEDGLAKYEHAEARAEQAGRERDVLAQELAAYDEKDVEEVLAWAHQKAQRGEKS